VEDKLDVICDRLNTYFSNHSPQSTQSHQYADEAEETNYAFCVTEIRLLMRSIEERLMGCRDKNGTTTTTTTNQEEVNWSEIDIEEQEKMELQKKVYEDVEDLLFERKDIETLGRTRWRWRRRRSML
jgi:hypothetical protein